MVGTASYLYYMLYELYSPVIEVAGLAVTAVAALAGLLNIRISRQDVFRACITVSYTHLTLPTIA